LREKNAGSVLEIDSNLIENSISPSALEKKNLLFFGHPEAGERSAVIYSLLGSWRQHGINPSDHLKDLFTRLPSAKPPRSRISRQRRRPSPTGSTMLSPRQLE
jgi:hypothetical protein